MLRFLGNFIRTCRARALRPPFASGRLEQIAKFRSQLFAVISGQNLILRIKVLALRIRRNRRRSGGLATMDWQAAHTRVFARALLRFYKLSGSAKVFAIASKRVDVSGQHCPRSGRGMVGTFLLGVRHGSNHGASE